MTDVLALAGAMGQPEQCPLGAAAAAVAAGDSADEQSEIQFEHQQSLLYATSKIQALISRGSRLVLAAAGGGVESGGPVAITVINAPTSSTVANDDPSTNAAIAGPA